MKFINTRFQKTCFCKRAVLHQQIRTKPDTLFLLIWSVLLDICIILEVIYSVCFKFVLKEEFEEQVHDRVRGGKVSQKVSLAAEHSQDIASETYVDWNRRKVLI